VSHLINDHKVDLHEGCTFNHRYVKPNPYEVENATWMLTVSKQSTSLCMLKYVKVWINLECIFTCSVCIDALLGILMVFAYVFILNVVISSFVLSPVHPFLTYTISTS
jgi:hypothetical protein